MHIWAHIFFYLSIVMVLLMLTAPFIPEGRARIKANKTRYVFVILVWITIGAYAHDTFKPESNSSSSQETYQQLDHKVNKSAVKEESDGDYYVDKDDSKLRYFTSGDDKVTAAKYVYGADHMNVTSVKDKLSGEILNDDNLKYTKDKTSDDKFLPKGDSFNVYSPKNKKWYHVSMQRDDNDKVSSFSVWPGKDDSADDF